MTVERDFRSGQTGWQGQRSSEERPWPEKASWRRCLKRVAVAFAERKISEGAEGWCRLDRSVAQSCLTLCSPRDCSTPGLSVLHHLPEFAQTHVHRVGDAIQPSHPLSSPSPPALDLSQHQGLFQYAATNMANAETVSNSDTSWAQ